MSVVCWKDERASRDLIPVSTPTVEMANAARHLLGLREEQTVRLFPRQLVGEFSRRVHLLQRIRCFASRQGVVGRSRAFHAVLPRRASLTIPQLGILLVRRAVEPWHHPILRWHLPRSPAPG